MEAVFCTGARALIYQPVSPDHPFRWNSPRDEDSEGACLCKKNIQKAENVLSDPKGMRAGFTKALNDIITF
jgi:hypothetical protein